MPEPRRWRFTCEPGGALNAKEALLWQQEAQRLAGKDLWIAIHEGEEPRRTRQNRMMWAINEHIAKECESTKERIHVMAKGELLPLEEIILPNGKKFKVIGSTAKLSVKPFSDYIDRLIRWAAENGIYVPEMGSHR